MLLAEVVRTSEAVASTRARLAKVVSLADLLRRLAPDEVEPAVAFLVGRPRQGKVGVGWATLRAVDPPPADEPSIEILELDRAVTELQALEGQGSGARRTGLLGDLFGPGHRGRGGVHPPAAHRRPAPGRPRRGDDRRRGQGRRASPSRPSAGRPCWPATWPGWRPSP